MGATITHFVFVDFENVPKVDLAPLEGKPVHVTLLIGKKQTWLDLSLVQQMRRIPDQVELIEVGASGHNALDLTLAWYLGATAKAHPAANFHIVSKDKDFVPLISHLQTKGIQVSRHDAFATLPLLAPTKKSPAQKPMVSNKPKPKADKLDRFIAHLRNSPPANRNKLEHMITDFFKPSLPVGGMRGVITELEKKSVIVIDSAGKVTGL